MPCGPQGVVCHDLVALRDTTATMVRYGGVELPRYMDAQPLPELGFDETPPRDFIVGAMSHAWMIIEGPWKLVKYADGETMLFNLVEDPHERDNRIDDPGRFDLYRQLDTQLTSQIMADQLFAMHDRLPCSVDLAISDAFGHEGWNWSYPSPVSWAKSGPRDVSR